MTIQGSAERVLDSVLPHEITHMVFASYFRRPLPRWADEGGATSVEHVSEKQKHRQMLVQFLRTGHGIAFGQMFAMTEYPQDVMPLYAQGYSLAEFLIYHGGRKKFVAFLADGMRDGQWSAAVQRNYDIRDLPALQNTWVAWVAQGFPAPLAEGKVMTASAQTPAAVPPAGASPMRSRARPEPNLIYHIHDKEVAEAPPPPQCSSDSQTLPAQGCAQAGTAAESMAASTFGSDRVAGCPPALDGAGTASDSPVAAARTLTPRAA